MVLQRLLQMFEICLGHVELFLFAWAQSDVATFFGVEATRLPARVLDLRHVGILL